MAQFDVYRRRDGDGFWLDCQVDLLDHLDSRFVVPLIPLESAPRPARHLNPVLAVGEVDCSLLTQFAGTVPIGELGPPVCSLAGQRLTVLNALDFLLTGV